MTINKKNILSVLCFAISYLAFLCLFFDFSFVSIVITCALFLLGIVLYIFKLGEHNESNTIVKFLMSFLIDAFGFFYFKQMWYPPNRVENLASKFGLSGSELILIVGIIACIIGFYAVFWISKLIYSYIHFAIKKYNPEFSVDNVITNTKSNIPLILSAISFFILNMTKFNKDRIISCIIAIIIWLFLIIFFFSYFKTYKKANKYIRFLSLLSSIGICLAYNSYFKSNLLKHMYTDGVFNEQKVEILSCILTILSLYFVYVIVVLFFKKIENIIINNSIFSGVRKKELFLYMGIIFAFFFLVVFSFKSSNAFYDNGLGVDTIYTSDSPWFVADNVFINLHHRENDIRQPLFAVFSAPFFGISYLISELFNLQLMGNAILISVPQIILLVFSNYLLSKLLKLSSTKRMLFVLFISSMFSNLLFSIMIEQYIIVYFWLIMFIYLIVENKNGDLFVFFATAGTLITNVVLLFYNTNNKLRCFKKWLFEVFGYGLLYLSLALAFCRFDMMLISISRLNYLTSFSGNGINMIDKLLQYISFAKSCFIYPDSRVVTLIDGRISWQMSKITNVNILGLIIIVITILYIFTNRKKRIVQVVGFWFIFSILLLVLVGWGTSENGLILYSLYFGWPFALVIFDSLDKIGEKINSKYFLYVVMLIIIIIMLIKNVFGIREIVDFAKAYYPI